MGSYEDGSGHQGQCRMEGRGWTGMQHSWAQVPTPQVLVTQDMQRTWLDPGFVSHNDRAGPHKRRLRDSTGHPNGHTDEKWTWREESSNEHLGPIEPRLSDHKA